MPKIRYVIPPREQVEDDFFYHILEADHVDIRSVNRFGLAKYLLEYCTNTGMECAEAEMKPVDKRILSFVSGMLFTVVLLGATRGYWIEAGGHLFVVIILLLAVIYG